LEEEEEEVVAWVLGMKVVETEEAEEALPVRVVPMGLEMLVEMAVAVAHNQQLGQEVRVEVVDPMV
jgi:hypothetical protein